MELYNRGLRRIPPSSLFLNITTYGMKNGPSSQEGHFYIRGSKSFS